MMRKRGVKNGFASSVRAQITTFVILGVILLIIFLLLYFLLSSKGVIRQGEREKVEAVPAEFKPVQSYVEGCIHKLGLQAVKKMGVHGGYIDPLDAYLTPVELRFSSSRPTSYELASLSGDSSSAVPYYLFVPGDASYHNYELSSLAPSIESMEYQLARYIERELPGCVGGFEELEAQGFEVSPSNDKIKADVKIRDELIEIKVNYPVNISKGGVKTLITGYTDNIRFPLTKYYELAIGIMSAELVTQFLESFTINLIDYHSGVSYSLLPPRIDYTNAPYVITWSNSKVRLDLDSLLQSYVPALQVINSSGYTPIIFEGREVVEQNFYKSLSMDIFNETINESITFYYVSNSLRLRVQPSKGDIIKPNIAVKKGNQFIPESQFNTYKFFYDVSYPIVVEIRGKETGTEIPEYSFLFALEANLIENKPPLAWLMGLGTVDWDYSYLNVTVEFPDGSITDEEGNPLVIPRMSFVGKNLFCDEDTWLSGEASVTVQEEITAKPIEGATLSYGCGDYQECFLGSTDERGEWKGKLPLCTGGYLSIVKDGYGAKTLPLTTKEGVSPVIGVQRLYKIKELTAKIKKYEVQKVFTRNDDWEWEAGPDNLGGEQEIDSASEQVILSITQTGFEAGNNPLSASLIFGKDGVENPVIQLVPGEYEVTATLIDYNGLIIPANCSRICSDRGFLGIGCTGYTYFPDPAITLEEAPWGGIELTQETTGAFIITSGDLENAQEIEFRVLKLADVRESIPSGGCLANLEEMDKLAEYSRKYSSELMPRLR